MEQERAKALINLTPAEGKRLIAKGVLAHPAFQRAMEEGTIIVAGGTTNGYIAEELLGKPLAKEHYTLGVVTGGYLCITPLEQWIKPLVLRKGVVVNEPWKEALQTFKAGDVFLKGANAWDYQGMAGVLCSDPNGGTIGAALGPVTARGGILLMPVGFEKLIPSVREASSLCGVDTYQWRTGLSVGMVPVSGGIIISEAVALKHLFDVRAVPVAAGGIGGSQGSVTLVVEGEPERVEEAFLFIRSIKGEPGLAHTMQHCPCSTPCQRFDA